MFYRLGQFCFDRRWAVIVAWIVVAAGLRLAAPSWSEVALDGDLDQLPADTTTTRAARLNAEAFPDDRAKSQLAIVVAREDAPLSAADRQVAHGLAHALEELPRLPLVDEAWTETTPILGSALKSADGRATRVVVRLTNDLMAVDNMRVLADVRRLVDERRASAPPGLEIGITGSAAIGGDMLSAAAESLRNTDRTTIVLVVLVLAVIYRSPWLVAAPVAAIAVAAVASLGLLALLAEVSRDHPFWGLDVRVFTTTRVFVVVLLFGAGTDFCLFLIARFRELRAAGVEHREAVAAALDRVGAAISASALTTIVGLAMMGFAEFGKFAYSGPAIALSLAIALAVCVTLAPALLSTRLGARVGAADAGAAPRRWDAWWSAVADRVLRRPGWVLAGSALVAAPLAWYGAGAPVTYDIFSELDARSVSRRGTALLQKHFPAGEVGPLMVLAHWPAGGLDADDGRLHIAELTNRLFEMPGTNKVRSLYRPTGEAPGAMSLFSGAGIVALTAPNHPLAKEAFLASLPGGRGDVTRLFVTLDDPPFSAEAVATVSRIERSLAELSAAADSPWRGATFELLGPTSGIRDLERVTLNDRRNIEVLVAAAVLAVILVLLRRPVVCAFLIATVIVSYLVTLGVVRLLLDAAYGADYPGLDWKAPVFLFVILVAVGQDYNIYLVTRVFEEQRRLGPLEGLRRGLVQTGGIITSCGVIMAATFGSMITGSLRSMVELGVALSLGILLDTFVVRTVVVPAFLAVLARRAEATPARIEPVLQ
jgi:putative drug exporter of the RND superfamily